MNERYFDANRAWWDEVVPFPYSVFRQFPFLERGGDLWHIPAPMPQLPLVFSIRARKD